MSFKRDGNDENLLKNLNHQRVRELLSCHIPQDEAKMLSNGRLTCTICLHRPIFDTINMLSIHRQGKRHLLELSKYIKCKEDAIVKTLQRKIHTDNLAKDECSVKVNRPNLVSELAHSPLLGARHVGGKQYALKHHRKPALEIQPTLSTLVPKVASSKPGDSKSASATVRQYLKSMSRKSSLEKVVERNRDNYGVDLQKNSRVEAVTSTAGAKDQQSPETSLTQGVAETRTNNEAQDYEIKLRMCGWIKDSSGKWIKDPNVEFDSDEDDIPPPPTT